MKCSSVLLAVVLFACSCSTKEMKPTDPWPYGTTYEIFVQSFADSNGDGIGDIPGLTSKLDYLQDLGVQAVWLMPIHPSPSYHKYDVTDYFDIHPDYGTKEDFKAFVEKAHSKNIRVIMDLVVNHTSWDHPWFKDAITGENAKYRDYYVWRNIDDVRSEIEKKEVTLDSDNIHQWHPIEGNKKYYYGFFWKGMPDLNYDNPAVRQEVIEIGKYWLQEFDVDGYRLDAAGHIFPRDRAKDSHAWWLEFGNAMRALKPDVYLVGEEWGTAKMIAPYLKGLHSMFNFNLYFDLHKIIIGQKKDSLLENLVEARSIYENAESEFIDAIFVNNHDRNRIINEADGDIRRSELAFAIVETLPGMAYVYYGDEIGMRGEKPDEQIREPYLWAPKGAANEQTTWVDAVYSTYENVIPLSEQLSDPNSTLSSFKYWIGQRNKHEALRTGKLFKLASTDVILSYGRSADGENLGIYHNLTDKQQIIPLSNADYTKIIGAFNHDVRIENSELILPAFCSAILR